MVALTRPIYTTPPNYRPSAMSSSLGDAGPSRGPSSSSGSCSSTSSSSSSTDRQGFLKGLGISASAALLGTTVPQHPLVPASHNSHTTTPHLQLQTTHRPRPPPAATPAPAAGARPRHRGAAGVRGGRALRPAPGGERAGAGGGRPVLHHGAQLPGLRLFWGGGASWCVGWDQSTPACVITESDTGRRTN